MFGLARVPTVSGDRTKGNDFFISPFGVETAPVKNTDMFGDNSHNAILAKVPMLLPCRSYLRAVFPPPEERDFRTVMGHAPKEQAKEGSRKHNRSEPRELPAPNRATASSGSPCCRRRQRGNGGHCVFRHCMQRRWARLR